MDWAGRRVRAAARGLGEVKPRAVPTHVRFWFRAGHEGTGIECAQSWVVELQAVSSRLVLGVFLVLGQYRALADVEVLLQSVSIPSSVFCIYGSR